MADGINELRARLNPIIAAGITVRAQALIQAAREVTDGARHAEQPYGTRMLLGLEAVYRNELTQRGVLVSETVMQAVSGLSTHQPMDLADDLKRFINEHLESSRAELARELKGRSGKQSQENETFNTRFEMHELHEELLRSYGAKIDLWATQRQAGLNETARARFCAWIQKIIGWVIGIIFK